jgi:hypothetical protein
MRSPRAREPTLTLGAPHLVVALVAVCGQALSLLLIVSGVEKWRYPLNLSRALVAAGISDSFRVARGIGAAEIFIGGVATILPLPIGFLAPAAAFVAFGGFLVWVLGRRLELPSCGCMGRAAVPPSWLHAALNGVAASVLAAGWLLGADTIGARLHTHPVPGILELLAALAISYALYLTAVREGDPTLGSASGAAALHADGTSQWRRADG